MNNIKVLDCTLRDGGYINQWKFGENNIRSIISNLSDAEIDIVECGYLTQKAQYNNDYSLFNSIEKISEVLPKRENNSIRVCMINYGDYDLDNLPDYNDSSIEGIRIAFHKGDRYDALEFCKEVSNKGYKVFMQPMVSVSYDDLEFIDLIKKANSINPYAFYIVDSFGVMKQKDLMRLYYLVDHNLKENIYIGYHSHNNFQLAYSNAQTLIEHKTERSLIIDTSIFGMGRGAGNLNTELFIEYLNSHNNGSYKQKPILKIIDEVLNKLYKKDPWGYSLPHYISASHNCHPNYASYLAEKNTLNIEDIDNLLGTVENELKKSFNKSYIEDLYYKYQSHKIDDTKAKGQLKRELRNRNIVILGPGSSIRDNYQRITSVLDDRETIGICINFKPSNLKCDYIFVSNKRRYERLKGNGIKKIVTSNIEDNDGEYILNYGSLLNNISDVKDNSGLMLIKFLIEIGVKNIILAGFDGYTYDSYQDYTEENLAWVQKKEIVDSLNEAMKSMLDIYSKEINIEFLTESKYQRSQI